MTVCTTTPRPPQVEHWVTDEPGATPEQIDKVVERIATLGFQGRPLPGAQRTAVAVTGNKGAVSPDLFASLKGVKQVVRISAPYKLVSREVKPEDTIITFDNGVKLGGPHFQVMAGPCSVESRDQIMETAQIVGEAGIRQSGVEFGVRQAHGRTRARRAAQQAGQRLGFGRVQIAQRKTVGRGLAGRKALA